MSEHTIAELDMFDDRHAALRNLTRRPAKPARWRGRVQLEAQRVLWLFGTATTADVIDYAYVSFPKIPSGLGVASSVRIHMRPVW
jgi:hypothetical protein